MTLAADGHLVKVHRNIVALASPYIKAMIESAACQHPVVFLNNINHSILSFILEYIYTGEVKIPTDATPAFIQACKALCINGIENIELPQKQPSDPLPSELLPPSQPPPPLGSVLPPPLHNSLDLPPERPIVPPDNNFAAHITISSENNVEVIPADNTIVQESTQPFYSLGDINLMNFPTLKSSTASDNLNNAQVAPLPEMNIIETDFEYIDAPVSNIEENNTEITNSNYFNIAPNDPITVFNLAPCNPPPLPPHTKVNQGAPVTKVTHESILGNKAHGLHYSISKRGSLQLILNQFMYHCHHHASNGLKRRWRCVDYRKLHCPAYIDTNNDIIYTRSEHHNHGHHKTQIMRKLKSNCLFTSITQATNRMITKQKPKDKPKKFVRNSNTSRGANQIIKVTLPKT
ncbi:uncharacterized protein LOC111348626 isoform X2 [Spodoptera litura]|nr:uncharacterized protein LOC111348626 isoform X2 [Spodoptera litura]